MKRFKLLSSFALAAMLFSVANADYDFDIYGQIANVDNQNKTITLASQSGEKLIIKVLPYTEIKGDDCGPFGTDTYGTFRDLTVGKYIKVEAIPYGGYNAYNNSNQNAINPQTGLPSDGQLTAKEIEWQCGRRAY